MNLLEIDYTALVSNYEKWWNKELDRPIVSITLADHVPYSRGEVLNFTYDFALPPIEVARRYQQNYESQLFLGDAFPGFYMRTTGLLGVFMGQTWNVSIKDSTVWYDRNDQELEDLSFEVDEAHPLLKRALDLNRAFQDHFRGRVVLGGANLGGVCDVYHSIRGMENALFDIKDSPDLAKRGFQDIQRGWIKTNQKFLDIVDPRVSPGYTHWTNILSSVPYDMIQADLAFLLGEEDYREFIQPLIEKESQIFARSMFHMDGPGFVRHLSALLSIPTLDGVQWIPGAGAEPVGSWPEMYEEIAASDKLLQVYIEGARELPMAKQILAHFKNPSRVCLIMSGKAADRQEFERFLDSVG